MKQQIIVIFLLVSFIAPVFGIVCWLQYQKYQVKYEVKTSILQKLPKEDLVLLKFSREEMAFLLKWEHSREFEFNGEMYDVVESEICKDSVYYWCWWDHQETVLNQKLKDIIHRRLSNDQQRTSNTVYLIQFFNNLFYQEHIVVCSLLSPVPQNLQFPVLPWNPIDKFPPPLPPPRSGATTI